MRVLRWLPAPLLLAACHATPNGFVDPRHAGVEVLTAERAAEAEGRWQPVALTVPEDTAEMDVGPFLAEAQRLGARAVTGLVVVRTAMTTVGRARCTTRIEPVGEVRTQQRHTRRPSAGGLPPTRETTTVETVVWDLQREDMQCVPLLDAEAAPERTISGRVLLP